ncbi:histidine--tRNA ligase [Candidatus Woesearchaeota archaeon]|nr:histidine--tRNA ligase [Candidatus Woesearchaeota archaeon]
MKLQRAKGTRDFPPEEKILRNYVVDTLRRVFELYGFPPMETPIIERFDVLAAKYAGGAEILKEMFQLTDQGGRKLGLRYDLTVPFSRYVGMNPTMKMPFKRYAIGRVFRDGPIKLGRYREFWQCDCDVVGCKNMTAEVELINIALTAFERLGLNVRLEVNNRKLLDALLDALGISDNKKIDVILTIDKLKKIPRTELVKELKEKGLKNPDKLLNVFEVKGSNKEKIENIKKIIKEDSDCLKELEEIFALVKSKKVEFNPALARGLAYYTGTVFEVFMNNSDFTSSLMGGGRFDNMIADFLGTKKEFPAVGISFGVEPISEMLKLKKKRDERSVTKVFVIPIGTKKESMNIAAELRAQGINTEIDIMDRGISKNLDYANYYKIPFVVFVGEEELKKKKVKLKNMDTGEEKFLAVKDILKVVAD